MEVNKVVYNGDTLLDLTSDTVTPQTLLSGATAHAANGQSISGTVDLNGKADKVANATAGNFAGLDASGNLIDSNKSAADFATPTDLATKQDKITQSATLTLTVAGWDSATLQQTVAFTHDTTKRNVIDITLGEMTTWGECGVRAVSETAAGITFECDTVPETALTFKVISMEVG
jgi:hypothetical protein